jgi:hypothetical protein
MQAVLDERNFQQRMQCMLDINHARSSLRALRVATSDVTSVATGVHAKHAGPGPGSGVLNKLRRYVPFDLNGATRLAKKQQGMRECACMRQAVHAGCINGDIFIC